LTAVLGLNPAMTERYAIVVKVQPRFVAEESDPDQDRYVFAYTVEITNAGEISVQLRTRHWIITDERGKVHEVRGPGVVGKQPFLEPGQRFEYTSGAMLETSVGVMRGSYQMLASDGHAFDAPIDSFTLTIPRTLH
jgi:ApaG protein